MVTFPERIEKCLDYTQGLIQAANYHNQVAWCLNSIESLQFGSGDQQVWGEVCQAA